MKASEHKYFKQLSCQWDVDEFRVITSTRGEKRCQTFLLQLVLLCVWFPPSDLPTGSYIQEDLSHCSSLCEAGSDCCDLMASCKCGTHTGQYDCICEKGYYGKGLQHECTGRGDGDTVPHSMSGSISHLPQLSQWTNMPTYFPLIVIISVFHIFSLSACLTGSYRCFQWALM